MLNLAIRYFFLFILNYRIKTDAVVFNWHIYQKKSLIKKCRKMLRFHCVDVGGREREKIEANLVPIVE